MIIIEELATQRDATAKLYVSTCQALSLSVSML